jgi:ATP-dependent DNA ligase
VVSEYTPMASMLAREPFHRDGWVYEEKVDGWRMLACKDGEHVRLISRNGVDHTRRFAKTSRTASPDQSLPEAVHLRCYLVPHTTSSAQT